jgi:hypothetical protein
VARLPQVAAEVQRLTLLHSPHDAAAQADHVAARLLELSKSQEPAVALRAIAQWGKLAEAGLLKPPTTAAVQGDVIARRIERARMIDDLKGLYEKAFGAKGPQRNELVVSTKTQSIEEVDCQIVSDGAVPGELPAISAMDQSLQSLPECPTDQEAAGTPIPPEVTEEAVQQEDEYEWQYQPGSFGKPRRVRVRVR